MSTLVGCDNCGAIIRISQETDEDWIHLYRPSQGRNRDGLDFCSHGCVLDWADATGVIPYDWDKERL